LRRIFVDYRYKMCGTVTKRPAPFSPNKDTAPAEMIASTASFLIPLALTTSLGSASPSFHRDVRAYVTGYNTVAGQTDSTPCIAASTANICGRRDAVACPRHISLGTTVEIRGATYVCEDRLAKKFDKRFDISCDKDTACPQLVTGWTTIKVYDADQSEQAAAPKVIVGGPQRSAEARPAQKNAVHRLVVRLKDIARATPKLASATGAVSVLRGRG
jgi:hypothetical protein